MSDKQPIIDPLANATIDADDVVEIQLAADTVVTHNADGTVTVPISDDTFARIEAMRRPGESDNDVLRRLLLNNAGSVDYRILDGNRRSRALGKGKR
jgi:hypothetical protein